MGVPFLRGPPQKNNNTSTGAGVSPDGVPLQPTKKTGPAPQDTPKCSTQGFEQFHQSSAQPEVAELLVSLGDLGSAESLLQSFAKQFGEGGGATEGSNAVASVSGLTHWDGFGLK